MGIWYQSRNGVLRWITRSWCSARECVKLGFSVNLLTSVDMHGRIIEMMVVQRLRGILHTCSTKNISLAIS